MLLLKSTLKKANNDPVVSKSRKFIEKVNQERKKELIGLCKDYGQIDLSDVFIYAIDRLGFDLLGKDLNGNWLSFRVPWNDPVSHISQCDKSLNDLF